jgi:4,5-dihydroxyphthalate decarboxylase
MWVRGMMLDEGVAASEVSWHVGGLNEPGPGERIRLDLPDEIEVHTLGGDDTLDAMLADGQLDAIVSPRLPAGFVAADGLIRRLFDDLKATEIDYYRRTGFFPIMHCLAVRKDVAQAHPWLPAALFRAFCEAKLLRFEEMAQTNVLRVSLPWFVHDLEETMDLTGGDPWPYGFERNRAELEAMTRYAHADGIAVRRVTPEELFDPDTLALTG